MTSDEARGLKQEIPEDVYIQLGSLSGTQNSWLLLMILQELRELRQQMAQRQDPPG